LPRGMEARSEGMESGRTAMSELNVQADFELSHDAWGRLVLVRADGRRHEGVEPVRCFPLSDPDRWIALCDAEGAELLVIEDLKRLAAEQRAVLEADLAKREFVPRVTRVLSVPVDAEPAEWEVETDRGVTRFWLNSSDDVRRFDSERALLIDSQGIRYLIED